MLSVLVSNILVYPVCDTMSVPDEPDCRIDSLRFTQENAFDSFSFHCEYASQDNRNCKGDSENPGES